MVDRRRVCEVYGDGGSAGTGYLVADGLVLTAAHVVEDGAARLRFPAWDPTGLHPARPVWTSTGLDAALLRLDTTGRRPPAGLPPVRWGRLVTGRTGIRAEALGFPDAHAEGPAGLRDWAHVSGTVNAHDRAKSGRIDLAVDTWPRSRDGCSEWAGMSGAALFAGGLFTGLITDDPPPFESRKLIAVRADTLLTDTDLAAALGRPALEPVELAALQHRPPLPPGPLSLLRADAEVVPFRGRGTELARLRDWLRDDRTRLARVLTGPGGRGKTRLAREFARRASVGGWASGDGWAVVDLRGDAGELHLLGDVQRPLLVVVDYPERRDDQLVRLVAALAGVERVRLLLVARTAGEWQDGRLVRRTGGEWLDRLLVAGAGFRSLLPDGVAAALDPVPAVAPEPRAYWHALTAFAARLAVDRPGIDWAAATRRAASAAPGLDKGRHGTVLTLQMEALARLLSAGDGMATHPSTTDAATVVLEHEARYWTETAPTIAGLERRHTAPLLRRLVTVVTLCTARAGTESLSALLGRLPDLAGERAPTMTAIEAWLTALYGEPGWTCAALRPDPLHEHLVATEVAEDPYLLHPVVPGLTERQACELLYVLARATMVDRVSGRAVAEVVHELVQRFPDRLLTPARIVVPQVERPAARVLRRAVTAAEATDLADDRTRQQRLSDAVATVTNLPSALRRLLFRRRRDGSLARTASSREPIAGPSPVVAGSAAATPLRRIADAVTLAAHRVAHRTAASPFGQAVQQYHEAARRGGAAVAAVALPALLVLQGSGSPPAHLAAPPPVAPARAPAPASTGQAATAPPATAPSATAPPGAVPSTGEPPTGPPTGQRSTSAGASPVTSKSALPPADGKHPVTVDATALSTSRFAIIGITGPVDSRSRQELRMAPGRYRLTTNGSPSDAWFTVTAVGTVEYDAGITYLGGRGTATLVVRGLLITVDARQLTASTFAVFDVIQNADKRVPHALRMLPGRYRLATVSCWTDAYFTLTPAGTVDYDAGITYFGGRGTPMLTVHGLSVTIDARQLTAPTFSVQCVIGGADRSAPRELRVLPKRYGIAAGTQWSTVGFTVTAAGTVTYDDAGNPYLSGKGGTTVTVRTATLPPS